MARSVLVLPTPLRPSTQVISPTAAERDAAERLAGAVPEIDVLDAQHGSASQIDFDHALAVLHLVERALGQDGTLVQHGDLGLESVGTAISVPAASRPHWRPRIA